MKVVFRIALSLCVCMDVYLSTHTQHSLLAVSWLLRNPAICVSQGWICLDSCTSFHAEIEVFQTCSVTHSDYTDTGPTSPGNDPVTLENFIVSLWIQKRI